ncbi:MAG: hypothetical protein D6736_17880, partial [Nitrospinota bacterium]
MFTGRSEAVAGSVLIHALLVMAVLTLLGITAITTTSIDLHISGNYRLGWEVFYLGEAGAEHGREALRVLNAGSTNPQSFTDELTALTGSNGLLDGYEEGTDDVPLLGPTPLGAGTYTVYLTNDLLEGASNPIDNNGKVTLTAVASGPQGSQAVVESTVALFPFFPLPAAITLLG